MDEVRDADTATVVIDCSGLGAKHLEHATLLYYRQRSVMTDAQVAAYVEDGLQERLRDLLEHAHCFQCRAPAPLRVNWRLAGPCFRPRVHGVLHVVCFWVPSCARDNCADLTDKSIARYSTKNGLRHWYRV